MGAFRYLHRWTALVEPGDQLADNVALLEDRDRELEDYLAGVLGQAGNTFISYTTGGTVIVFPRPFKVAPSVVVSLETPGGTKPYSAFVDSVTTTQFKVRIYGGSGAETPATGSFRVFWHALPIGA